MIADRWDRQFIGAFMHALIESSRPRFTAPRVFRLFLHRAAVARKVFHLIVTFFAHLGEELSKRARQLVMFIAEKRAARSATSSRFSGDSYASTWKLRNISPAAFNSSCSLFFYSFSNIMWIMKLVLVSMERFDLHFRKQASSDFTWFLTIYFDTSLSVITFRHSLLLIFSVHLNRLLIARRSKFSL